jgi:hypothetical protein
VHPAPGPARPRRQVCAPSPAAYWPPQGDQPAQNHTVRRPRSPQVGSMAASLSQKPPLWPSTAPARQGRRSQVRHRQHVLTGYVSTTTLVALTTASTCRRRCRPTPPRWRRGCWPGPADDVLDGLIHEYRRTA